MPDEAPGPPAERPRYLSSRPLLFSLCPGGGKGGEAPSPLHEHPLPGPRGIPAPHRYRSGGRACVRRGRQPRAGGRALPAATGGEGGEEASFSGEGTKGGRGKRAMGEGGGGPGGGRGCCRADTPRRQAAERMGLSAGGCARRASAEGEGKEASRLLPRTMAAPPIPIPSSLCLPSLPAQDQAAASLGGHLKRKAPAARPASRVPAASPPRVSSGAAGGAGAAGRPGGSRAPPAR